MKGQYPEFLNRHRGTIFLFYCVYTTLQIEKTFCNIAYKY